MRSWESARPQVTPARIPTIAWTSQDMIDRQRLTFG
jgi:hypothetical protein